MVILHEILLPESMEAWHFKSSIFSSNSEISSFCKKCWNPCDLSKCHMQKWPLTPPYGLKKYCVDIITFLKQLLHIFKIQLALGHGILWFWQSWPVLMKKCPKSKNHDFLVFYENWYNSSSKWYRKLKFGQVMHNNII